MVINVHNVITISQPASNVEEHLHMQMPNSLDFANGLNEYFGRQEAVITSQP